MEKLNMLEEKLAKEAVTRVAHLFSTEIKRHELELRSIIGESGILPIGCSDQDYDELTEYISNLLNNHQGGFEIAAGLEKNEKIMTNILNKAINDVLEKVRRLNNE